MFRLLNKSAIWLPSQCVNHCLQNCQNYPSPTMYFSQLLHLTHPHVCPPAMGGQVRGRLVGRWSPISQAIQVRRFSHLGDVHSKQWAALIASPLWAYLVRSFGRIIELMCTLFFVRIWLPAACGVYFLKNHKTKTECEPQFLLQNLPKPTANQKMETITAQFLNSFKSLNNDN